MYPTDFNFVKHLFPHTKIILLIYYFKKLLGVHKFYRSLTGMHKSFEIHFRLFTVSVLQQLSSIVLCSIYT